MGIVTLPSAPKSLSPAAALAETLHQRIIESCLTAGAVVASAQELRALSDAGRPVVQQAVRILEERGVAYMRRGAGGGLVVSPVTPAFAGRALSIELERVTPRLQDHGVLPVAVDTNLYLEGAARASLQAVEDLRRLAVRLDRMSEEEFIRTDGYRRLWHATRLVEEEPVSMLAQHVSFQVTTDNIPYSVDMAISARSSDAWRLSRSLVDAVVSGDVNAMFECRRGLIEGFRAQLETWADLERDPDLLPAIGDRARPEFRLPGNRADRLVREIVREIRILGWEPGARLGSGVELMARYRVGPDIFRQAIVQLQEHAAVTVAAGRTGGVFVAPSNRHSAVLSARDYLARSQATVGRAQSFLRHLAIAAFDGFPLRDDAATRAGAGAMLTAGWGQQDAGLWAFAKAFCRSGALDLFVETLEPLVGDVRLEAAAAQRILDASVAGDHHISRRLLDVALTGRSG